MLNILHMASVGVYLLLLLVRFYYLFTGKDEQLVLFSHRQYRLGIATLAVVAGTGVVLSLNYVFDETAWFLVKLAMLVGTLLAANYAFRNFSKMAGLLALVFYLYTIAISVTRNPLLYPPL